MFGWREQLGRWFSQEVTSWNPTSKAGNDQQEVRCCKLKPAVDVPINSAETKQRTETESFRVLVCIHRCAQCCPLFPCITWTAPCSTEKKHLFRQQVGQMREGDLNPYIYLCTVGQCCVLLPYNCCRADNDFFPAACSCSQCHFQVII